MHGWKRRKAALVALCGGGLLATAGVIAAVPAAGAKAPAAPALQVGCGSGSYTTIGAALKAAKPGATVSVCAGTYKESVALSQQVKLVGHGATIDATGFDTGVTVTASGSTVTGFVVENATGEGILVSGAPGKPVTGVLVSRNIVTHNDLGNPTGMPLTSSPYMECNAGPNNVPGDCGEGIHLMGAESVAVDGNVVYDNSGGILLTDETGPTAHDLITHNQIFDNPYDCGITLAGHQMGTATATVSSTKGGVYDDTVYGNLVVGNGTKGQGGGVLLATGVPGGAVYHNLVSGNVLSGNGLAGVTVHSHLPKAAQDLNGNVVEANLIQTNNLTGDEDFTPYVDSQTTGIIVATLSPLSITVRHNTIDSSTYGVWAMPAAQFVGGLATNTVTGGQQLLCTATPASGSKPSGCATS